MSFIKEGEQSLSDAFARDQTSNENSGTFLYSFFLGPGLRVGAGFLGFGLEVTSARPCP